MTTASTPGPNSRPVPPAAPLVPARRRWWLRWAEHGLAIFGLVVLICCTTPLPMWAYDAMDRQGTLTRSKYIICLGGDNARIIESVRLLRDGWGERLILSNYGLAALQMRDVAEDWGAPVSKILLDEGSRRTADHPASIARTCGVDPAKDTCIIVTSYSHMARSLACFEKAGYRHVIMREPRWERPGRYDGYRTGFWALPRLVYEGAAWIEYKIRGFI